MTLLAEVASELVGMFLADLRLSGAILALVTGVAGLLMILHAQPLIGGVVLLIGCHAILIEAAFREARGRRGN